MPLSKFRGKILIVDDDPLVLEALKESFIDTYDVVLATAGQEALDQLQQHRDTAAIILDIRMAKMDGFQTARHIRESSLDVPIIFHTGYPGDYSHKQTESMKPSDYIGKNENPERLAAAVRNAVRSSLFKNHPEALTEYARDMFEMVGHSQSMLEIYRIIDEIGPKDDRVLILGETGTGKELVAKALHRLSSRAGQPLVPFTCGHKPPDLVEDELFGHVRGAFTGALTDREGLLETANNGTVFLDEIGELDLNTQVKLLRVLEDQKITRLGSMEEIEVDVRVICATNANLDQMVAQGRFRSDLFYRIRSVVIMMPPLRERREDIPELIDYFTAMFCEKKGIDIKYYDQGARDLLIEHDWKGNVRDLFETLKALISSTPSYFISRQDVERKLERSELFIPNQTDFDEQVKDFKRILIVKALDRHAWNVSKVAREFGKDPANFRKQIESLGITLG